MAKYFYLFHHKVNLAVENELLNLIMLGIDILDDQSPSPDDLLIKDLLCWTLEFLNTFNFDSHHSECLLCLEPQTKSLFALDPTISRPQPFAYDSLLMEISLDNVAWDQMIPVSIPSKALPLSIPVVIGECRGDFDLLAHINQRGAMSIFKKQNQLLQIKIYDSSSKPWT